MDKLKLTGQNRGRVFNSRGGHVYAVPSCGYLSKLPNLKLKTWPKQRLGYLRLDIKLPIYLHIGENAGDSAHTKLPLASLCYVTTDRLVPIFYLILQGHQYD